MLLGCMQAAEFFFQLTQVAIPVVEARNSQNRAEVHDHESNSVDVDSISHPGGYLIMVEISESAYD